MIAEWALFARTYNCMHHRRITVREVIGKVLVEWSALASVDMSLLSLKALGYFENQNYR